MGYLNPDKLSRHLDLKFHLYQHTKKKFEGIAYFSHGKYTWMTSNFTFAFNTNSYGEYALVIFIYYFRF